MITSMREHKGSLYLGGIADDHHRSLSFARGRSQLARLPRLLGHQIDVARGDGYEYVGRGDAAVTFPPMDGALRPNQRLEEAHVVMEARAPDNLILHHGEVLFSSGRDLRKLETGAVVRSFDRPIACLAAAVDGRLAVGLTGAEVVVIEPDGTVAPLPATQTSCATALAFLGNSLIICRGSARYAADQWKRDLMESGIARHGSGSVVLFPRDGVPRLVADQLRWPFGVLPVGDRIVISESWAHRLVLLDPHGSVRPQPVLLDLPGYPARLARHIGRHGLALSLCAAQPAHRIRAP